MVVEVSYAKQEKGVMMLTFPFPLECYYDTPPWSIGGFLD